MSRLWPYLLTEFATIFDSKYLKDADSKIDEAKLIERLELVKEGLKLVHLMSSLNIEAFCMN
jgi:hypothetical protein